MAKHIKQLTLGLGAVAALALCGAAFANAGGSTVKQARPATTSTAGRASVKAAPVKAAQAADTDNDQSGDQSAPESPDPAGQAESAQERPDTAGEASGSEVPGDDGPGGHADEPGNPKADHQSQGQE